MSVSFSMKRHLRIMKTLRWTHAYLDQRIVTHKGQRDSGYLLAVVEAFKGGSHKKKALAYPAHLRRRRQHASAASRTAGA